MARLGILVLVFVCQFRSGDAAQSRVQPVDPYRRVFGNYNYYNANNIPYTIYNFCLNNLFNCQTTSADFCARYDTTCNYNGTANMNYYYFLLNTYCPAWCERCKESYSNACKVKSSKKCEYSKYKSSRSRILQGNAASQCGNPWTVALRATTTGTTTPFCQGVLLDKQTVATTQECLNILVSSNNAQPFVNITATVGEYVTFIKEPAEKTSPAIVYNVDYSTGFVKLRLSKPVDEYNYCVSPACLPSSDRTIQVDRSKCKIVGWGITHINLNNPPAVMNTANVTVAGDSECKSIVSLFQQLILPGGPRIPLDTQISGCTTVANPNSLLPNPAACVGDEGGAVTCEEKTTGEQILVGLIRIGGCNALTTTFFSKTDNI